MMPIENVLSLNVRLSEGGAARVMLSIHDYLIRESIESKLAYGYGPHGGTSAEEFDTQALRLTSKTRTAINLASHGLTGAESVSPSKSNIHRFEKLVEEADVVHLHAVHSFFWKFPTLIETLTKSPKKIIWTMHDSWILTGRCAIPGDCSRWKTGCGACPNKDAYPPSRLDFSSKNWGLKRQLFETLSASNQVQLVSVSNWLASDLREAGFQNVVVVNNGLDSQFFDAAISTPSSEIKYEFLFVNRDLRDKYKVSVSHLNMISKLGKSLTVVGDNAPAELAQRITLIPSVKSRALLARLMKSHKCLIFTSRIDNFPLTVVEALISGLEVIMPNCLAAQEFLDFPQVRTYSNDEEFLELINSNATEFNKDMTQFSPQHMPYRYLQIYKGIPT
jgi:putative colanic acid biosynthesis glycosyltransferase